MLQSILEVYGTSVTSNQKEIKRPELKFMSVKCIYVARSTHTRTSMQLVVVYTHTNKV